MSEFHARSIAEKVDISNFRLLSLDEYDDSAFINRITTWTHNKLPVNMVMCHFQLRHFTSTLFHHFDISLPNQILKSVSKRQAEFLAGRVAAQKVMQQEFPHEFIQQIKISKNRAPDWPQGYCGSISHTENMAVSIASRVDQFDSLGVDLEGYLSPEVSAEIAHQIHSAEEILLLNANGVPNNRATTLIFSAKESLFKALYKYVNEFFGFESAFVDDIDLEASTIYLVLEENFRKRNQLRASYMCHFSFLDEGVLTIVSIPSKGIRGKTTLEISL
ncbi:4'-phosphopantetheinyl transferase EntD [Alteromonas sp. 76-1]|uniref:4'-phosphopantetheinyl transferase family protein n=1 Tax=Alteromonas sp. 76-1 TaxID=2358187 RepID=UPI000FD17945|nr:4'-phosphopantetheinyl transferase superfamily protein [Alteromonas sp. 76-1]VEL98322.1 4'-phosphopantetheinyl transferase EntD [Alteromonas sp. 76-1]